MTGVGHARAGGAVYGRWVTPAVAPERVRQLAHALDLPLATATVLAGRGLATPEQAAAFLDPRLDRLTDPFRLAGMERAVERVRAALSRQESIVVFGDYDVDGVAAAALLAQVLRKLGGRVEIYLPDRVRDGYGLTLGALQRCLARWRPTLLVTVDCGTGAAAAVAAARQAGCDTIVTDHHAAVAASAGAVAEINPRQSDRGDPVHCLAGVGVAFKLCHALVKRGRQAGDPRARALDLRDWLELVALGTVADVVPLRDENRILVHHGLARLARTRHAGLRALMDQAGVEPPLASHHVGFGLAPRLNAAGRMGHPGDALALLLATDRAEAQDLARKLECVNQQRRAREQDIREEALARLERQFDSGRDFGLALAGDDWESGVIGIVASRICRAYCRPAAVASFRDGDPGKGSCRSIEGVNVLDALQACRAHLQAFGGHAMAAGFSVTRAAWPAFRQAFNAACREQLAGQAPSVSLTVDAWLAGLHEVDARLHGSLQRLAPFGQENPRPVLGLSGLSLRGVPRVVGKGHLKFRVGGAGRQGMEAIAFGMAACTAPDGLWNLAAHIDENCYRGETKLQLNVKDFG